MKKLFYYLASTFAFIVISGNVYSQVNNSANAPDEIQKFLNTHYQDKSVIKFKQNKDKDQMKYKITLSDNTKLKFDNNYKIVEIDSKGKVPESVVPIDILTYVKTNYPDNYITDWELENSNQHIELNNGVELEFNMKGEFVRID